MSSHEAETTATTEATSEIEIIQRRELALRATDAVSDVYDRTVSIPSLIHASGMEEDTPDRLKAKRALRCIGSLAARNSDIAKAILNDEDGIYNYAEGVIMYGADDKYYLGLMETYHLNTAEATGIYALREMIGEYGNTKPGFGKIIDTLSRVGLSVQQASMDPEAAVEAFYEAGFFVDHTRNYQYNTPVFAPNLTQKTYAFLEDDIDGTRSEEAIEVAKEHFRLSPEESEVDTWQADARIESLKNLIS